MKKTGLVWFKTDLRIHDNPVLQTAIKENDEVVLVYCLNRPLLLSQQFGITRTSYFRMKFLFEALRNLDENLKKIGSGLIVLDGDPMLEIQKMVDKYKARKVYAKREVTFEEKQLDLQIQTQLQKSNVDFETYSTSTLYNASDLPFSINLIPNVFTTFRKKVEQDSTIRECALSPESITSPLRIPFQLPTLSSLNLKEKRVDARSSFQIAGGETNALQRLNYFLFEKQLVKTYKLMRNSLTGNDFSSKLSPFLALGCISPKFIYHELKKYESEFEANDSTYWFYFELLWRDYFRFTFKKYKEKLFRSNGIKENDQKTGKFVLDIFQKWTNGKTGEKLVDACMLELKHTGYMSNRGRQNVASYWIHDLKQDWRYGAAYFESKLVDYEASSNWGNWAYLAGVGNDPSPSRKFNLENQSLQYDPKMEFRNLWLK